MNPFSAISLASILTFQELCRIMLPHILMNARSTGAQRVKEGRKPKLTSQQRLLNCILFLKKVVNAFAWVSICLIKFLFQEQTVRDESARWNTSRSSLADDAFFICTLICQHMSDEIAGLMKSDEKCWLKSNLSSLDASVSSMEL